MQKVKPYLTLEYIVVQSVKGQTIYLTLEYIIYT